MFQQRVKLRQISIISLVLAIIFAFIAIVKAFLLCAYITCYLIAISILCEGALFHLTFKRSEGLRLLLLGLLLFITTSFLFIRFLRGL